MSAFSRLVVLAPLALVAVFQSGCSEDCADAGCVPALFLDGSIEPGSSDAATIEACFNASCESAELAIALEERCARLSLSSDSSVCIGPDEGGRREVALEIHSVAGELAFRDGDRIVLRIDDAATGQMLANVEVIATYSDVFPNGRACGEPCRAASLTF